MDNETHTELEYQHTEEGHLANAKNKRKFLLEFFYSKSNEAMAYIAACHAPRRKPKKV